MQSYEFPNVSILALDQNNEYFDSDFKFGSRKNLTIQGYFTDLSNSFGVSGVTEGIELLRTGLQDYKNVIINGFDFGNGRINKFSVDEGNHVQHASYTVDIECFESGNLFNLEGELYTGLNHLKDELTSSRLLSDFQETFSFAKTRESYGFSHNISFTFISGDNIIINPIDRGKALATYLMTEKPSLGFLDHETSGFYTGNPVVQFEESYDMINHTVDISKSFDSLNPSGDYSILLTHNLERADNGVTNVTEAAEVKTHLFDKKTSLPLFVGQEIGQSFVRCSGVFESYETNNSYPLNSAPLLINKNFNLFEGVGGYSVEYTNNPNHQTTHTWDYTLEINKQEGFYDIRENGNVKGIGRATVDKYNNAHNGFEAVKSGISARALEYYQSFGYSALVGVREKSESRSKYNGLISYDYTYTDDPRYTEPNIPFYEVSIQDNIPVDYTNKFEVVNMGELVQGINTTTLGSRSLNLNISTEKNANFNNTLTFARSKINQFIPQGNDTHVGKVDYEYNIENRSYNFAVEWLFNRPPRGTQLA